MPGVSHNFQNEFVRLSWTHPTGLKKLLGYVAAACIADVIFTAGAECFSAVRKWQKNSKAGDVADSEDEWGVFRGTVGAPTEPTENPLFVKKK
jgi:hypothetical protein